MSESSNFFVFKIMGELIGVDSTQKTITSVELAKLSNREHKDIIKSIEAINKHLIELEKGTIPSSYYKANNGAEYKQYILNRNHAELVAMKMDTKVMIKVHEKFQELQKPKTYEEIMREALILADTKVKELENKNLILENQIEEDKPLVSFAKVVGESADAILIREFSKMINLEGIDIGEKRLFKWLRSEGYLNYKNEPFQQYKKYFNVTERPVITVKGTMLFSTTRINGLGQVYFLEKIKKDFIN